MALRLVSFRRAWLARQPLAGDSDDHLSVEYLKQQLARTLLGWQVGLDVIPRGESPASKQFLLRCQEHMSLPGWLPWTEENLPFVFKTRSQDC